MKQPVSRPMVLFVVTILFNAGLIPTYILFRQLGLVNTYAVYIVPALIGFFSVAFRSCDKKSYEAIIEDRAYLVAKNQEQLGAALSYIAIALLVWGLIIAVGFLAMGKKKERGG